MTKKRINTINNLTTNTEDLVVLMRKKGNLIHL